MSASVDTRWRHDAFDRIQAETYAILEHPAVLRSLGEPTIAELRATADNGFLPNFNSYGRAVTPKSYEQNPNTIAIVPLPEEEFEYRTIITHPLAHWRGTRVLDSQLHVPGFTGEVAIADLFNGFDPDQQREHYAPTNDQPDSQDSTLTHTTAATTLVNSYVWPQSGYAEYARPAEVFVMSPNLPAGELGRTRLHEDVHARNEQRYPGLMRLAPVMAADEVEAYRQEYDIDKALGLDMSRSFAARVVGVAYDGRHQRPMTDQLIRDLVQLGAIVL